MAEETITILRVGTDEAVRNIVDLQNNIKALKEGFEDTQGVWHDGLIDLKIGTEQYKETLEELKVNQNALKDAMYATSTSMEDLTKAATGASDSYNSLVHRMAALKEEFRATNDEARRVELGNQIKEVNQQLKAMDEMQGNFQRNVGNYAGGVKSALKDMSKEAHDFAKSLKALDGSAIGLKRGFDAFARSPGIATIGILVSIVIKLADSLKENETAMAAIKKGLAALKPIMDFFSGILEKVADFLADIITDVTEFVTSNGLFQKIIRGVMGVGNAIVQFVIAPFKGVVEAIKVFKEQGIKGFKDAAKAFGQEVKSGVSFKQNFQAGQTAADTLIAGAKSRKKSVKGAGKELAKDLSDGFIEEFDKILEELDQELEAALMEQIKKEEDANKLATKRAEDRLASIDKATKHMMELNSILAEDDREREEKSYQIQEEANQRKLSLLDQFMQEALDRHDIDAYLAFDQERADLQVEIETNALQEKKRIRQADLKDAQEKAKAQKSLMMGLASATSSILGTIADMYEQDAEDSAESANKVKGLRIAAATIDTITGAIGAFMQASETIPPPYGQIIGAISAAAVTAAGIAQIAQIKNTKVSTSSSSHSAPTPAVASAPALNTQVSNVRNLTSASEEERLNQMASDQRVYILSSDIEASQGQIKTQVSESSF